MSRFAFTTAVAAVLMLTSAAVFDGPAARAAIAVIAAMYAVVFGLGVAFVGLRFFCSSLCRLPGTAARVALTFDDGPDPNSTPAILDLLHRHGVRATFFCVGINAMRNQDLVRRIAAEGHLVANHSFHHGWWNNFLFGPWQRREIGRCQEILAAATGEAPRFYRSPMGLTNPHLPGTLRVLGLQPVGWDCRAFDRKARVPQRVIDRVAAKAGNGSIIALHDGGVSPENELAIVEGIIVALRLRQYSLVRLDEGIT